MGEPGLAWAVALVGLVGVVGSAGLVGLVGLIGLIDLADLVYFVDLFICLCFAIQFRGERL